MSKREVIKLGQELSGKYTTNRSQEFNANLISRAINALNQIIQGDIEFGKPQAQRMLSHLTSLNQNQTGQKPQLSVSAVDMNNIIANMVFNKMPDNVVIYNARLILSLFPVLEDTGSFKESFIKPTMARYDNVLSKLNNDSKSADEWARSGTSFQDWRIAYQSKPAITAKV